VSQTNSVAKSVSSSHAEENILHRCEMYLNSTDTQNSFFNLKKLPEKYDVSFTQEAPTNHYLPQTLPKPTYDFQKKTNWKAPIAQQISFHNMQSNSAL
jgi:hypothetical protein